MIDEEKKTEMKQGKLKKVSRVPFYGERSNQFGVEEEASHYNNLERARANREASFGSRMTKETAEVLKGPKYKAPFKAIALALESRKRIENFDGTPFIFLFVFAGIIDAIDIIPMAGWVVTLFMRPFLFVALWGKGTWRMKVVRILLILLDFVPLVGMLPWSTLSVAYVYFNFRKEAKEARQMELALAKN